MRTNLKDFPINCPTCGKLFAKIESNQKYCSHPCYAKRARPIEDEFWKRVIQTPECWIWFGSKNVKGYGFFRSKGRIIFAHRYSFVLHGGKFKNEDDFVCHHCDNPSCVRPDHLFAGTSADNVRDCIQKNRKPRGEKSWSCKITEDDVREIRKRFVRYARGENRASKLAEEFGISRSEIYHICGGYKWNHVT